MATTARMTATEYIALPNDERWCELIDGVVVVNEPRVDHGLVFMRLAAALQGWVTSGSGRGYVLPPTDVRIDEHNVYGPDVLWFSEDMHRPADLDAYHDRIPDLCVEIRSASTWRYDVGAKMRVYEAAGLPELWLVDDAAETMLVYRRSTAASKTYDVALELDSEQTLTSPSCPTSPFTTRRPLPRTFRRGRRGYSRCHEHGNGREDDPRRG